MGKVTKIAWADSSWNPWIGCTKVSPGCDHCYAESQDHRWGHDSWGKGKPRRLTSDSNWKKPLQWNREAEKAGVKHKVFCGSLCDVMDDEAPEGARERLWSLIDHTPYLIWQLLTKRPHRYERYLPHDFVHDNVWIGTTCENQEFYDVRWPLIAVLRQDRGFPAWISYEPAIGPLTMDASHSGLGLPDWIICGGESGAGFRPMEQKWAEDIKQECEKYGVAFFMKQMSARIPDEGKHLIPAHLIANQFPVVK